MRQDGDFNPEIEKFWNHLGYTIDTDVLLQPVGNPWRLFWFLMKNDNQIRCVGQSEEMQGWGQSKEYPEPALIKCSEYYWDGELYNEDEMLRIIKMKVFT